MNCIKNLWNIMGNIYISVYLILFIIIDSSIGYFFIKNYPNIFSKINDIGLINWINTYGLSYIGYTFWFFLFLILLFLFSINMFICTTQKVNQILISNYYKNRLTRLSPHIMHYAVIFILCGFLVNYLFSDTKTVILIPNKEIKVFNGLSLTLKNLNIKYYIGNRLSFLDKKAISCRAKIKIQSPKKTVYKSISINSPGVYWIYTLHLRDFSPKTKFAMSSKKYILLTVKKDYGIYIYLSGTLIFIFGLFIYVMI